MDDRPAAEAEAVLARNRSVDAATRGNAYRESGWQSFDEQAPTYTSDPVAAERGRYRINMNTL